MAHRPHPTVSVSLSLSRAAFQYCSTLVRKNDLDGYLCGLLLPEPTRSVQWALRAFNVETSRISDVSKNPLIAKMRLQFWREAIDRIFAVRATHALVKSCFFFFKPSWARCVGSPATESGGNCPSRVPQGQQAVKNVVQEDDRRAGSPSLSCTCLGLPAQS